MAVSVSTSIYKVLLALSFTLVIILGLAVYVSSRKRRAQSPTVETPVLKVAAVEFESGGPKYDVIVWNRTKFSTGMFDMQEISQSRIEVKSGDDEYRFEWP